MTRCIRRSAFTITGGNYLTEIVCLLCVLSHVLAQTESSFTFPDFSPTTDSSLTKVFTTTVVMVSNNRSEATFIETIFLEAATSFYSGAFPGFLTVNVNRREIKFNTTLEIAYQVDYDLSYNYAELIANASSDSILQTRIGNAPAVKNGLETTITFRDEYTVSNDPSNFTFTGNRICQFVSCGSTHVFCNETELGLSPICRSDCHDPQSAICQNGASCKHTTVDRSPTCNCLGSASVWYVGQYCEYKIELWMIIVFLLLYLLLVAIILAVGCWCWKRAGKTRRRDTYRASRKDSPIFSKTTGEASQYSRKNRNIGSLGTNAQRTTEPLRSPSPLSSIPEEYSVVELPPVGSANAPASRDDSSDNHSEVSERSGTSQSNTRSEAPSIQPYSTLVYDARANNEEDTSNQYGTPDSPGHKSTQTNTEINVNLSDSILARNIS